MIPSHSPNPATRVLVTGGAGFIGSALVRHLVLERGAEVLTVDKLTYAGDVRTLAPVAQTRRHRLLQADVADRGAMDAALAEFRPEAILHLAAESHVDRSIAGAEDFVRSNVVGTYTLLEAARAYWRGLPEPARSAFRFLHVSTDEVYGSLGAAGRFDEASAYDPSSPYSASKAASDHLVTAWGRTYGLPVLVTNCSNNYGPYQFPEKLIPLMTLNALAGEPLPVYGDGGNVRDWLHVEDHVEALVRILARGAPGARYNVGGDSARTNLEVVRRICAVLDGLRPAGAPHERLVTFVADRPGHDRRYAVDASKLARELGWRARHTFETGVEQTVRWYLDNEAWWRPLRDGHVAQAAGSRAP